MKSKRMNEKITSGVFLLVFAIVMIMLTPLQVDQRFAASALPPTFFPYAVFGSIALMSLLLILQGYQNRGREAVKDQKVSWRDLSILLLASVFILSTAEWIGFTFACMVALGVVFYLIGVRSWRKILLSCMVLPIAVDLLYRYLLQIFLPLGFWEALF